MIFFNGRLELNTKNNFRQSLFRILIYFSILYVMGAFFWIGIFEKYFQFRDNASNKIKQLERHIKYIEWDTEWNRDQVLYRNDEKEIKHIERTYQGLYNLQNIISTHIRNYASTYSTLESDTPAIESIQDFYFKNKNACSSFYNLNIQKMNAPHPILDSQTKLNRYTNKLVNLETFSISKEVEKNVKLNSEIDTHDESEIKKQFRYSAYNLLICRLMHEFYQNIIAINNYAMIETSTDYLNQLINDEESIYKEDDYTSHITPQRISLVIGSKKSADQITFPSTVRAIDDNYIWIPGNSPWWANTINSNRIINANDNLRENEKCTLTKPYMHEIDKISVRTYSCAFESFSTSGKNTEYEGTALYAILNTDFVYDVDQSKKVQHIVFTKELKEIFNNLNQDYSKSTIESIKIRTGCILDPLCVLENIKGNDIFYKCIAFILLILIIPSMRIRNGYSTKLNKPIYYGDKITEKHHKELEEIAEINFSPMTSINISKTSRDKNTTSIERLKIQSNYRAEYSFQYRTTKFFSINLLIWKININCSFDTFSDPIHINILLDGNVVARSNYMEIPENLLERHLLFINTPYSTSQQRTNRYKNWIDKSKNLKSKRNKYGNSGHRLESTNFKHNKEELHWISRIISGSFGKVIESQNLSCLETEIELADLHQLYQFETVNVLMSLTDFKIAIEEESSSMVNLINNDPPGEIQQPNIVARYILAKNPTDIENYIKEFKTRGDLKDFTENNGLYFCTIKEEEKNPLQDVNGKIRHVIQLFSTGIILEVQGTSNFTYRERNKNTKSSPTPPKRYLRIKVIKRAADIYFYNSIFSELEKSESKFLTTKERMKFD